MAASAQMSRPSASPHGLVVATLVLAAVVGYGSPSAGVRSNEPQSPSEYEVKAGFLFNFALFVHWPASAFDKEDSPIVFAVVGRDPFGRVLDAALASKRIHERPIEIRRFRRAQDVERCHVLFVPGSESENLTLILRQLRNAPVLLVGEKPGFARAGGVVNFYIEAKKVRFEINPETAKERDLRVSSKLLKLARIVGAMEHE